MAATVGIRVIRLDETFYSQAGGAVFVIAVVWLRCRCCHMHLDGGREEDDVVTLSHSLGSEAVAMSVKMN